MTAPNGDDPAPTTPIDAMVDTTRITRNTKAPKNISNLCLNLRSDFTRFNLPSIAEVKNETFLTVKISDDSSVRKFYRPKFFGVRIFLRPEFFPVHEFSRMEDHGKRPTSRLVLLGLLP